MGKERVVGIGGEFLIWKLHRFLWLVSLQRRFRTLESCLLYDLYSKDHKNDKTAECQVLKGPFLSFHAWILEFLKKCRCHWRKKGLLGSKIQSLTILFHSLWVSAHSLDSEVIVTSKSRSFLPWRHFESD